MGRNHEITIRVRYAETDAMGFLHHANYLTFFELGRTELFRSAGGDYRAMEEQGLYLVVVDIKVKYRKPARYDDLLRLTTELIHFNKVKLVHEYKIYNGETLLAEGESSIVCVDGDGNIRWIPDNVLEKADEV